MIAVAEVVSLAVASAIVIAVVHGGSTRSPAARLPGAGVAASIYRGIPQHGLTLGARHAPVRMVVYIDLQCPVCRDFETNAMPDLVARYVRTGKAELEIRPWAFIGPDSARGQAALFAAAKQNRAFEFAQVLYDNQGTENTGWLTDAMVTRIGSSVPGLDVARLLVDRGSTAAQAAAVARSAQAQGVSGTPTVFVGRRSAPLARVGSPGAAPTGVEVARAIESSIGS